LRWTAYLLELLPFVAEQEAAVALLAPLLIDRTNVSVLRQSLGFHLEHEWRFFLAIIDAAWKQADATA